MRDPQHLDDHSRVDIGSDAHPTTTPGDVSATPSADAESPPRCPPTFNGAIFTPRPGTVNGPGQVAALLGALAYLATAPIEMFFVDDLRRGGSSTSR
jgi:hypothetical protein